MTLSRLLFPLDKMDFRKVRKNSRSNLKKTKICEKTQEVVTMTVLDSPTFPFAKCKN